MILRGYISTRPTSAIWGCTRVKFVYLGYLNLAPNFRAEMLKLRAFAWLKLPLLWMEPLWDASPLLWMNGRARASLLSGLRIKINPAAAGEITDGWCHVYMEYCGMGCVSKGGPAKMPYAWEWGSKEWHFIGHPGCNVIIVNKQTRFSDQSDS